MNRMKSKNVDQFLKKLLCSCEMNYTQTATHLFFWFIENFYNFLTNIFLDFYAIQKPLNTNSKRNAQIEAKQIFLFIK